MSELQILECTLRDGSYAIDFQFTAQDTAIIAAGLEDAGFRLIEVGHGLGLNASNAGEGVAAAMDEEYLEAVSSTLKKAKFGMFFIPGIGREEDLKLAADYGMGFVRIGTNAPEAKKAKEFIKLAKSLDMEVSLNLMKSYALRPKELAECGKLAERWGADVVAIVDSAGGMLPKEVEEYVKVMDGAVNAEIGFHGHDNLSMVHANCLVAIEAGATRIDSSLQGMGRSAGNAQTETLIALLEQIGLNPGIDLRKVMDLGKKMIKPLIHRRGTDPIEVTLGYAKFHSKFLKNIYKAAAKYDLDPRELIIRSSQKNVVDVPEELAMTVAQELIEEKKKIKTRVGVESKRTVFISVEKTHKSEKQMAKKVAKELLSLSRKTGKESIFTIAESLKKKKTTVFPFIRETFTNIIGNAEVRNPTKAVEIAKAADGLVDIIIVDAEMIEGGLNLSELVKKNVKKSRVFSYKDSDAWVNATATLLSQIRNLFGLKIAIVGCNNLSLKFALNLAERGAEIVMWDEDKIRAKKVVEGLNAVKPQSISEIKMESDKIKASSNVDVLISFALKESTITKDMVQEMNPLGIIFDAGVGTISLDAVEYAQKMGREIYRLDMRAGLSGEIINVLETESLIRKVIGKGKIAGVPVVAGGIIGKRGDIVLDSISNPQMIIGVADGRGNILRNSDRYEKSIRKVKMEIMRNKIR